MVCKYVIVSKFPTSVGINNVVAARGLSQSQHKIITQNYKLITSKAQLQLKQNDWWIFYIILDYFKTIYVYIMSY